MHCVNAGTVLLFSIGHTETAVEENPLYHSGVSEKLIKYSPLWPLFVLYYSRMYVFSKSAFGKQLFCGFEQ